MPIMLLIRRKNWKKCEMISKPSKIHHRNMIISVRMKMKNSLTLPEDEIKKLLDDKCHDM